jgi:hypothetical protein
VSALRRALLCPFGRHREFLVDTTGNTGFDLGADGTIRVVPDSRFWLRCCDCWRATLLGTIGDTP